MSRDQIVEEVREIREAYARQFNFDLRAIHRDLKKQEKGSGRRIVSFSTKATKADQLARSR